MAEHHKSSHPSIPTIVCVCVCVHVCSGKYYIHLNYLGYIFLPDFHDTRQKLNHVKFQA
jgi:hypothetical protein